MNNLVFNVVKLIHTQTHTKMQTVRIREIVKQLYNCKDSLIYQSFPFESKV
jgi:hypothetical protein